MEIPLGTQVEYDDLMPFTNCELDWRKDMIQEIQFQGMTHDAI
jgi:hypothetical protein